MLTETEREAIARAIRTAEERTSGEIFCVLAGRSDSYFYPAAVVLAGAMLVVSLAAALVAHWLWYDVGIVSFVLAQGASFATLLVVLWLAPDLRIAVVPRALRHRRAHDNAARQFLAHNVHHTVGRTGVMIFVSLAERYAEVLADSGIAEKVPQGTWNDIVARLVDDARQGRLGAGFERAVAEVGALLAESAPPVAGDRNELDDHIAVI